MNNAQYLREMYAAVYDESLREELIDEARDGYGDDSKFKQDTDAKSFRPGKDVPKVKKFGRISRAMPPSISGHSSRTGSRVTSITGGDPGAPRSQKIATSKKMLKKDGKWVKEAYDVVLSHLLDEGYADTEEAAISIMANMSEDWRESILEEQRPLPISKMSKQARRKAFNAASETHSDETGIGLVASGDKTAKQIRTMARVGGKPVKSHIKKGYEQGRQYDPYYQELNSRNPSRNKYS